MSLSPLLFLRITFTIHCFLHIAAIHPSEILRTSLWLRSYCSDFLHLFMRRAAPIYMRNFPCTEMWRPLVLQQFILSGLSLCSVRIICLFVIRLHCYFYILLGYLISYYSPLYRRFFFLFLYLPKITYPGK
ncbi:hypothetical protein CW304_04515 [Bacillus sp. UFRGS-B20]|nr:hypothetical protein CW304_04515 [Bacillus sp. UFRGS-B20]